MLVRGIAYWAFVNHYDKKYKQYKVDLEISKKEYDRLRAAGLKVTKKVTDDDRIIYTVKITRNLKNKKTGADNPKPDCIDAKKQPFTGLIGNGSEVIVKFKPYSWNYEGKSGIGMDFEGLQIVNLIEYISDNPEGEGSTTYLPDDDEDFEVIDTDSDEPEEEIAKPQSKKKTSKKEEEEPEY